MKVCIPIDVKPEGGVYTFVGTFLTYLAATGHPSTQSLDDDFDVLLTSGWIVGYKELYRVKRRRPELRIVHRIDGSSADYGGYESGDERQARVNLLADLTIFQSVYSRFCVREKFRVIAQDGPIIYNPVDITRFHPAEGPRATGPVRVASAAWSTNRRKGTWELRQLARDNPDLHFVVCGPFEAIDLPRNLHALGHLDRNGMAAAFRSCDVFLNLSENDPCPNVVLEALATGLPVVFRSSGGVPELVGDCGAPIGEAGFRAALDDLLPRLPALSFAARRRAETRFAPEIVFPAYLDAIGASRRRLLPTRPDIRRLSREGYPVTTSNRGRLTNLIRRIAAASPRAVQRFMEYAPGMSKRTT